MVYSKTFVNVHAVQKMTIFEIMYLLGLTENDKNMSPKFKC